MNPRLLLLQYLRYPSLFLPSYACYTGYDAQLILKENDLVPAGDHELLLEGWPVYTLGLEGLD